MQFDINTLPKSIYGDKNLVIHFSRDGISWSGTPNMTLEDMINLRKVLRKHIINAKKKRK